MTLKRMRWLDNTPKIKFTEYPPHFLKTEIQDQRKIERHQNQ